MAKKNKWTILGKNKSGTSMIHNETGVTKKLLTPKGKAEKFLRELSTGVKETNTGKTKVDQKGNVMFLTEAQKAYRSGWLDSRKDSAAAYKAKNR